MPAGWIEGCRDEGYCCGVPELKSEKLAPTCAETQVQRAFEDAFDIADKGELSDINFVCGPKIAMDDRQRRT